MTNTAKIRNMVREKGDIDEMIFAAQGKDAGQTQTHSDRWKGGAVMPSDMSSNK